MQRNRQSAIQMIVRATDNRQAVIFLQKSGRHPEEDSETTRRDRLPSSAECGIRGQPHPQREGRTTARGTNGTSGADQERVSGHLKRGKFHELDEVTKPLAANY